MKMLVRILIIFCAKRALKYEQISKMLLDQEGVNYIYAVGTMIVNRNAWLNRIKKLQEFINK